jgi:hypothetical protein
MVVRMKGLLAVETRTDIRRSSSTLGHHQKQTTCYTILAHQLYEWLIVSARKFNARIRVSNLTSDRNTMPPPRPRLLI